nr:NADH dehydrogenase subunit 6 [Argyropelecus affinis]BBG74459.1 NADH dehydrogenase subunit 6 [Argyropelecus affinis]
MTFLTCLFLGGWVAGLVGVASNPAPYFAALGLVMASGAGCGVLIVCGGSFLSLVLFLIYLGGMLVVFAYSSALAAEPFPKSWWDGVVAGYVAVFLVGLMGVGYYYYGGWYQGSWLGVDEFMEFCVLRADTSGVSFVYIDGGEMLIVCAGVLLLTLFVVLELTWGLSRGPLRAA